MVSLTKRVIVFSDGTYKTESPTDLQLYQLGDDPKTIGEIRDCAYGGCPAVVPLHDAPDTEFTKDWQFYLVAINIGMRINNISNLMDNEAALFNHHGVGKGGRRNYLLGDNLSADQNPRTPKLISFCLNTHAGRDDGKFVYLQTMNGRNPPPMKSGKPRPQTISEIVPEDYLYLPQTHRHLFVDCTNVRWQPKTNSLQYGSWANGIVRDWIGDGRLHTFFPLVSVFEEIKTPISWWTKLPLGSPFPSPFSN
jgi:hypothetical protein